MCYSFTNNTKDANFVLIFMLCVNTQTTCTEVVSGSNISKSNEVFGGFMSGLSAYMFLLCLFDPSLSPSFLYFLLSSSFPFCLLLSMFTVISLCSVFQLLCTLFLLCLIFHFPWFCRRFLHKSLALLIINPPPLSLVTTTFIVLNYCQSSIRPLIYFPHFIRHSTSLHVSEYHLCNCSSEGSG